MTDRWPKIDHVQRVADFVTALEAVPGMSVGRGDGWYYSLTRLIGTYRAAVDALPVQVGDRARLGPDFVGKGAYAEMDFLRPDALGTVEHVEPEGWDPTQDSDGHTLPTAWWRPDKEWWVDHKGVRHPRGHCRLFHISIRDLVKEASDE